MSSPALSIDLVLVAGAALALLILVAIVFAASRARTSRASEVGSSESGLPRAAVATVVGLLVLGIAVGGLAVLGSSPAAAPRPLLPPQLGSAELTSVRLVVRRRDDVEAQNISDRGRAVIDLVLREGLEIRGTSASGTRTFGPDGSVQEDSYTWSFGPPVYAVANGEVAADAAVHDAVEFDALLQEIAMALPSWYPDGVDASRLVIGVEYRGTTARSPNEIHRGAYFVPRPDGAVETTEVHVGRAP